MAARERDWHWWERMPPNTFGIAFGIAALAMVWVTAHRLLVDLEPLAVGLLVVAGTVWAGLLIAYVAKIARRPKCLAADLADPVQAPFVSLIFVVGMLLGGLVNGWAPTLAAWLVGVCAVGALALGGWLTGCWIADGVPLATFHPGYFLPTVAGGFVGASALAAVGWAGAARMAFGIGAVCWLILGSLLLYRLFFGPPLPTPLVPTLAIEAAPPAVAGNAWFAMNGGVPDAVALGLAAYTILMVLAQVRLAQRYVGLPFMPSFWAFTFSYASISVYGVSWLVLADPPGAPALAWVLVIAATVVVLLVAWRTVRSIAAGQYFPPRHPQMAPTVGGNP
jgi:tellurite resistance protein